MRPRDWVVVAAGTAAWLALCLLIRVRYVEAEHLVARCVADPGTVVCVFRDLVGKAMHFNLLGYASLGLAVPAVALAGRLGRWLATSALLAAVVALVFYNAGLGALAAVLALVRLARPQSAPARAAPRPAPG